MIFDECYVHIDNSIYIFIYFYTYNIINILLIFVCIISIILYQIY